jgi:hypothetical protein
MNWKNRSEHRPYLENGGVDVDDDHRGEGHVQEGGLPAVRLHLTFQIKRQFIKSM